MTGTLVLTDSVLSVGRAVLDRGIERQATQTPSCGSAPPDGPRDRNANRANPRGLRADLHRCGATGARPPRKGPLCPGVAAALSRIMGLGQVWWPERSRS